MNNKSIGVGGLAVCLVAIGIGFGVYHVDSGPITHLGSSPDGRLVEAATSRVNSSPLEALRELEIPRDSRELNATLDGAGPDPEVVGEAGQESRNWGEFARIVPEFDESDVGFEKKYAGLNGTEIVLAYYALKQHMHEEMKAMADLRQARGDYEIVNGDAGDLGVLINNANKERHSTGMVRTLVDSTGTRTIRFNFAAKEYPDLAYRARESEWARNTAIEMGMESLLKSMERD